MRDEIIQELEQEYEQQRLRNERTEQQRREQIRENHPEIEKLTREREELVFGALRGIASGTGKNQDFTRRMEGLNLDVRNALKNAGFPEDYLAPVFRCARCRDTGYCGDPVRERCECFRKAYAEKMLGKIGISHQDTESFETFQDDILSDEPLPGSSVSQRTLTVMARDVCREWSEKWPDAGWNNMLLTGQSGLGKTFLLRCMAGRLIGRGYYVLLISANRFFQIARNAYFENDEETFQELIQADVLMIDDLGTEPMMQNITIEQLFSVISERQNLGKPVVISTNLDLNEMKRRYTERIASRMNDPKTSRVIPLAGRDLRLAGEGS